jgi:hypothetical protein
MGFRGMPVANGQRMLKVGPIDYKTVAFSSFLQTHLLCWCQSWHLKFSLPLPCYAARGERDGSLDHNASSTAPSFSNSSKQKDIEFDGGATHEEVVSDNLGYNDDEREPEIHARTYYALAAMFLLNMVQVVALQGPPAAVCIVFHLILYLPPVADKAN